MTIELRHKFLRVYVTLSVLYLGSVNSIKVDFGTSGGPIVPPTPFPPTPPPQKPYRIPAAVWEDQASDIPNPNPYKPPVPPQYVNIFGKQPPTTQRPSTTGRPQGSIRHTQIAYTPQKPVIQPPASTLSPAKSFVNQYAQPTKPAPTNDQQNQQTRTGDRHTFAYYNIVPELSLKYVPGFGFKYITPDQDKDVRKYQKSNYYQDKYNAIETNDIFSNNHPQDLDLSYDKYASQRVKKSPEQQVYVPQQTFSYYHQPQLFFPVNYGRH